MNKRTSGVHFYGYVAERARGFGVWHEVLWRVLLDHNRKPHSRAGLRGEDDSFPCRGRGTEMIHTRAGIYRSSKVGSDAAPAVEQYPRVYPFWLDVLCSLSFTVHC